CAAVFGVLVPLTIADITRGTGRFNLAQGIVGSGIGIGASLSTTLAGWMSDRLGSSVAFLGLACIGGAGLLLAALRMPETRARKGGQKLLAWSRNGAVRPRFSHRRVRLARAGIDILTLRTCRRRRGSRSRGSSHDHSRVARTRKFIACGRLPDAFPRE